MQLSTQKTLRGVVITVYIFLVIHVVFSANVTSDALVASDRGNIMYWKVHKVGSSTLRDIFLRKARARNLTARAHLSASHVVCREREEIRDAALRSLLGDNYVEVAFLREPIERALSGYYYIAMNARRSAAVRNASCGFDVPYMERHLTLENVTERLAFGRSGHRALQRCAMTYSGRNGAHVRVFLPQWAYWAPDEAAAIEHMRRGVAAGRFFVGLHERYDESLQLMARWLGWNNEDVHFTFRKKAFQHPRITDWSHNDREALRESALATGDWAFYAAARDLYHEQLQVLEEALQERRRE